MRVYSESCESSKTMLAPTKIDDKINDVDFETQEEQFFIQLKKTNDRDNQQRYRDNLLSICLLQKQKSNIKRSFEQSIMIGKISEGQRDKDDELQDFQESVDS